MTTGVYLIHFLQPYKHARHYIGFATDVEARIAEHRRGNGARLMTVVKRAGIAWVVAKVWPGRDRAFERRLKRRHGASRFCPICRGSVQKNLWEVEWDVREDDIR